MVDSVSRTTRHTLPRQRTKSLLGRLSPRSVVQSRSLSLYRWTGMISRHASASNLTLGRSNTLHPRSLVQGHTWVEWSRWRSDQRARQWNAATTIMGLGGHPGLAASNDPVKVKSWKIKRDYLDPEEVRMQLVTIQPEWLSWSIGAERGDAKTRSKVRIHMMAWLIRHSKSLVRQKNVMIPGKSTTGRPRRK